MNLTNLLKTIPSAMLFASMAMTITSCGGSSSDSPPASSAPVTAAIATFGFDIKIFRFSWTDVGDATFYRLMENQDGISGFVQLGADVTQGVQSFDHGVALYQRTSAQYFLQSCNSAGCTNGETLSVTGTLADAIGYFKASNTGGGDEFGIDVALSADGNTLAVAAKNEDSDADGINGDETNEDAREAGAVYIYVNNAGNWQKQAYIKAGISTAGDFFGASVSLSADGNILAVGATELFSTGTVYIFKRDGMIWLQTGADKADVTGADSFGAAISLSNDGTTLAVGAPQEDNPNTGVAAVDNMNGATLSGAAYIFAIDSAGGLTQEVYIKADNAEGGDQFGSSISLSSDGNTLVVGAPGEDSDTSGTAAAPPLVADTGADVGAIYVYSRAGATWQLQSYIKASNPDDGDGFGGVVSLSGDGNTLAVGAISEGSSTSGISTMPDNLASGAGAAYVFTRSATVWEQEEYIKASNTDANDNFGRSVSLSADGNTLAVGAEKEQSNALGINGDETNNALVGISGAGAAYVFIRGAGVWAQQAYVKASNAGTEDRFGITITLSADGNTLAVGANSEDSNAIGVAGDASNNDLQGAGAVYLY